MKTLKLVNACFTHPGQPSPTPLNAEFKSGQFVAIVGANGCGKTRLLKGLAGILPLRAGKVLADNSDWLTRPAHERACLMSYLEQRAQCYWPMPVERVVALGLEATRVPKKSREAIEHAMALTDVLGLRHRPASSLSGGEQARVMLARALATDPQILLADEALAGLDPAHQLAVMRQLKERVQHGRLILWVLHDMNLALRYCDHCLLLTDGEGLYGPTNEILTDENLGKAFSVRAEAIEHRGIKSLVNWEEVRDGNNAPA